MIAPFVLYESQAAKDWKPTSTSATPYPTSRALWSAYTDAIAEKQAAGYYIIWVYTAPDAYSTRLLYNAEQRVTLTIEIQEPTPCAA
jgi:hypothetical protein